MTSFAPLEQSEPFDVCIVGSGFGGGVLGRELALRGVRTLILESGRSLAHWMADPRVRALAEYHVTGDAGYPCSRTKARARGGNSNFWTGRCERFHPSDFARHAYSPPENPWPIDYQTLAPFYERAEATLRVRAGEVSKHAPPRGGGFPGGSGPNISALRSLLSQAGVAVDDSPTATPEHAIRFFRLSKELFPKLRASPNVAFVSGATVTRLEVDREVGVTGAKVRGMDGSTSTARARIYVVACGGLESPRLLLLSRSELWPEGIGNRHDRVGRGFNEHPGVNFYAKLERSGAPALRYELGRTHQFYDEFRPEGLGSVLPVFIRSMIFPNHLMTPRLSDLPRGIRTLAGRLRRPTLYIGATVEMRPRPENRVRLAADRRDRFGNPLAHLEFSFCEDDRRTLDRTRGLILRLYRRLGAEQVEEGELTWSRHHIGTCRMGADPRASVVDPDLLVHDCPNLYVSGSETFVTGAAVPPVLTIVALAHRLADRLEQRLRQK